MAGFRLQLLASPQFAIVIKGADGNPKEYTIHSAVLASMSLSLNTLVSGDMKEAKERRVVWDVDEKTLECFIQFAYSGDYTFKVEYQEAKELESKAEALSSLASDRSGCSRNTKIYSNCTHGGKKAACIGMVSAYWCTCNNPRLSGLLLRAVCSAHQRLLLFSDYHGIESLGHKARGNLFEALELSKPPHNEPVVMDLIRESYALPEIMCPRDWLVFYVSKNINQLWGCDGFRELLDESHQLCFDLLDFMVNES